MSAAGGTGMLRQLLLCAILGCGWYAAVMLPVNAAAASSNTTTTTTTTTDAATAATPHPTTTPATTADRINHQQQPAHSAGGLQRPLWTVRDIHAAEIADDDDGRRNETGM